MKAVFLDRDSFPSNIEFNYPEGISEVIEYPNTSLDAVAERIQGAGIVLTNKVVLTKDVIEQVHDLKLVQVTATGINNVDAQACKEHGIALQNVDGYSSISVPEHTFALLLALRRNLVAYIDDVRAGKWADSHFFCFLDYPIKDLANTKLTIVGKGIIGNKVAEIAKVFGMQVMFAEHKNAKVVREGYVPFNEAIQQADVLSLHCPLTETTKDLISTAEFEQMKPDAILLNMGRGGIVNEQALIKALTEKRIMGAGFDVATQEPMPHHHPLQALTKLPNFLLTPHIAWGSNEAMQKLANIAMEKIAQFMNPTS